MNSEWMHASRQLPQSQNHPPQPTLQDAWRKPGKAFRARLLKQDEQDGGSQFVLSPTCSIGKYFEVADRVLDQFLQHPIDAKEDLVEAYLVGNRLCRFLSHVLPTHPDYWSPDGKVVASRTKSHSQLVELMYFCKQLAIMIDEEEHQSYISRVLDSSVDMTKGSVPTRAAKEHVHDNTVSPTKRATKGHGMTRYTDPHADVLGQTSLETESSSETRDPSLDDYDNPNNHSLSTTSEENFDAMWAKVATTSAAATTTTTKPTNGTKHYNPEVRTRPMKDPSRERSFGDDVQEEPWEWHSFSEDLSWTKMSLSVSSSKFHETTGAATEPPARGQGILQPPQAVQTKRKKKKSKRLEPIQDMDELYQEQSHEWRIRRAQRNLSTIENQGRWYNSLEQPLSPRDELDDDDGDDDGDDDDDDYPPPPECDYPSASRRPPREPQSGSPTNVLDHSWPGWNDTTDHWTNPRETTDLSRDYTRVRLMTDGDRSIGMNHKEQRLSRRQRAIKGFKCVKCLVDM